MYLIFTIPLSIFTILLSIFTIPTEGKTFSTYIVEFDSDSDIILKEDHSITLVCPSIPNKFLVEFYWEFHPYNGDFHNVIAYGKPGYGKNLTHIIENFSKRNTGTYTCVRRSSKTTRSNINLALFINHRISTRAHTTSTEVLLQLRTYGYVKDGIFARLMLQITTNSHTGSNIQKLITNSKPLDKKILQDNSSIVGVMFIVNDAMILGNKWYYLPTLEKDLTLLLQYWRYRGVEHNEHGIRSNAINETYIRIPEKSDKIFHLVKTAIVNTETINNFTHVKVQIMHFGEQIVVDVKPAFTKILPKNSNTLLFDIYTSFIEYDRILGSHSTLVPFEEEGFSTTTIGNDYY